MNEFFWLIIGEIIVIIFICLIRYIFYRKENKKIDKIINTFKKEIKNNQNKNSEDKFQECLKIIKENNLRKDDKNGK